ncbi:hypothetical protein JG687_00005545 [Phytophthora cactorum]|uniref:Uncharacterized protein n=2 Tax=Phytophthora TaxID=4783 RepID=A0A329SDT2_9STRA|nr:hypothetical protein Pcac1_g3632 [Phytophthora cactorum]KAG6966478.1 hypothetical protein JG688_00006753 [Phytophthora aleatoria]KAG2824687.1 hypothetical protein PC111_g9717 [Phytophthora cactorum]KAG2837131.1 hypothetical protein PC112_g5036 [Phytophthora cactorum]KAG2867870.1 hypothetical protein PC113_g1644 [Phytophthora cactorum]
MDIRRLLHNPDDGGWYIIGETKSEAEMNDFRRSLKRNAIINTHLVNCTMNHENLGVDVANTEHKMKVQWTKCTSALCHPKGNNNQNELDEQGKPRVCPVQVRMSTCQLTFAGIVCQAYQHLSEEHDSAEPLQTSVTEEMKTHIVRMLLENPEVKPMAIYKELTALHEQGEFGADLMPTKIQLRNALTYLRSRKLKLSSGNASSGGSVDGTPRKRRYDSFSDGSESPPLEEHRQPEY